MKDITDEVLDKFTPEEKTKRRQILIMGEKTEMPEKVFDDMMKFYSYYEAEDVSDIIKSYPKLSEKHKIPTSIWMYNTKLIFKLLTKNLKFVKESMDLFKKYGEVSSELIGEDVKLGDLFKNKIGKPHQIYIHDVRLENFKHISNAYISAYRFDIRDRKGGVIEGVFVYDSFHANAVSQSDDVVLDKKNMIESARQAMPGTTYVVYAKALDEIYADHNGNKKNRPKRLLVQRIDDGGMTKGLPMPVISVR